MPARSNTHDCRVIAQAVCTGYQDYKVTGYTKHTAPSGRPYLAVRIGRILLYLEDREALTAFLDAFHRAHHLAERVFPLADEHAQLLARDNAAARGQHLRATKA